jgi:Disulphide bond corrector protein DsbC
MKQIIFLFMTLLVGTSIFAQSGSAKQVNWTFNSKKISADTYEIHMTAAIKGDYHLYAQNAGGEGPVPTTFTITKNPLITLNGKVAEKGKLIKKFEAAWEHNVNYYEKSVDFVQLVKLKGKAKTQLTGKVEFMVCNDELCLPPAEVEFKVPIGG